jgi:hypothetical protein
LVLQLITTLHAIMSFLWNQKGIVALWTFSINYLVG